MTDAEQDEITLLATAAAAARQASDYIGMCNTPNDPVERSASSVRYRVALAKTYEAEARLRRAEQRLIDRALRTGAAS